MQSAWDGSPRTRLPRAGSGRVTQGRLIEETAPDSDPLTTPLSGRRAKIVYRLTAEGRKHLQAEAREFDRLVKSIQLVMRTA